MLPRGGIVVVVHLLWSLTWTFCRAQFPSFNGSGNNLVNVNYGVAGVGTLTRGSVASGFADNISIPSGSSVSARKIVTSLFGNSTVTNSIQTTTRWTALHTYLFELVMLDWVRLAANTTSTESYPVSVPQCDTIWDQTCTGTASIPYLRSNFKRTGPRTERQAINYATPFLDLEFLYGNSTFVSQLRTYQNGRINLLNGFLPTFTTSSPMVIGSTWIPANSTLFQAGDLRINEHPALVSLVTLFAREHNRRAGVLLSTGTYTTDELIFQNARLWTIYLWQHYVQDELGAPIGTTISISYSYNNATDPNIDTFVAACASHITTTSRNPVLYRLNNDGSEINDGPIDAYRDAAKVYDIVTNSIDSILRGLIVYRELTVGPRVTSTFLNRMTRAVQRSKDLGIPTYSLVRSALSLARYTAFANISTNPQIQSALANLYPGGIDTIDGCVGALAEDVMNFGRTGPSISAAFMAQLYRSKNGDRFWFNTANSTDYLAVKQYSISSLVTNNTQIPYFPKNTAQVVNASIAFVNASASPPTSTGPTYRGVLLTDGLSVNWTTTPVNITFEITADMQGFVAFGLGTGMPNFQDVALIQWVNGAPTLTDAFTSNYSPGTDTTRAGGVNNLSPLTYYKDSLQKYHYIWTRPLNSTDPYDLNITTSGPNKCAFSFGTAPTVSYHGSRRGTLQIDFFAPPSAIGGPGANPSLPDGGSPSTGQPIVVPYVWPLGLQLMHGFFMVSAFYGAIPAGVIVARYIVSKHWLKIHTSLNLFVISQCTVSIITALVGANLSIFELPHGMLGVATFFLLVIVIAIGGVTAYDMNISRAVYVALKTAHATVGIIIWVMGAYNCFLGLEMILASWPELSWLYWLLGIVNVINVCAIATGEYHRYFYGKTSIRAINRVEEKVTKFIVQDESNTRVLPRFTWDDLNRKVSQGSLWMVIDKIIYDVTLFIDAHPGQGLLRFIGTDATDAFEGNVKIQMPATGPAVNDDAAKEKEKDNRRQSLFRSGSFSRTHIRIHQHSRRARLKLNTLAIGKLVADKQVKDSHFNIATHVLEETVPAALPGWIPMTATSAKGLDPRHLKSLKLAKKSVIGKDMCGRSIYLFRFSFERPAQEAWILPGDSVVLQIVTIDGKVVSRSYTPVNVYNKGFLDLVIKVYPGGALTSKLVNCADGEDVTLRGPVPLERPMLKTVESPEKGIHVDPATNGCFDHLGLISAGSGVTPMLLWLDYFFRFTPRDKATGQPSCRVTLLHQDSNVDGMAMKDRLDKWCQSCPAQVTIVYFGGGGNDDESAGGRARPEGKGAGPLYCSWSIAKNDLREYMPPPVTGGGQGAPVLKLNKLASSVGALPIAVAARPMTSHLAPTNPVTGALRTVRRRSSVMYTPLLTGAVDPDGSGDLRQMSALLVSEGSGANSGNPSSSGLVMPIIVGDTVGGSNAGNRKSSITSPVGELPISTGGNASSRIVVSGPSGFTRSIVEILDGMGYTDAEVIALD